tara:strand:+ start:57 stop:275 length:219 start_codon:yes stop_codon:yes gene_type:complete
MTVLTERRGGFSISDLLCVAVEASPGLSRESIEGVLDIARKNGIDPDKKPGDNQGYLQVKFLQSIAGSRTRP